MKNFITRIVGFYCSILIFASVGFADEYAIGVDSWTDRFTANDSPLGELISSGVERGLLLENGDPNPKVVDQLQVSADARGWLFAISPDAKFGNWGSIWLEDILFSLSRCQSKGIIPQSVRISLRSSGAHRGVVQLTSDHEGNYQQIASSLARCPIYPKKNLELTGEDTFFTGTHLVSAGPFIIESVDPLHHVTLVNDSQTRGIRLEVFVEPSAEKGMSKLRQGDLVAYLTSATDILDRARADTTLMVIPCERYNILARKGVVINCPQKFHLEDITYDAP